MTLNSVTENKLTSLVADFWAEHVKTDDFQSIFIGKEKGHKIADYVDEKTTELISKHFSISFETNKRGQKKARSMGDLWIWDNGIYNPVNIKAGEADKNGQPNLVSLNKIIKFLLESRIDSYHLIIIKLREGELEKNRKIQPMIYVCDLLENLEYATFDAGPGQLMLKEKQFYSEFSEKSKVKSLTIEDKLQACIDKLEDGNRRLILNREKAISKIRQKYHNHIKLDITLQQKSLNLGKSEKI